MPLSALRLLVPCLASPARSWHLFAPLRHPKPREERCAGQIVQDETSGGPTNTEARARISSTSLWTSLMPKLLVCFATLWSQDDNYNVYSLLVLFVYSTSAANFFEERPLALHKTYWVSLKILNHCWDDCIRGRKQMGIANSKGWFRILTWHMSIIRS